MKSAIKLLFRKLGFEIRRIQPQSTSSNGYTLYEYRDNNGVFDYAKYRRIQQEGNLRKLGLTWVIEENIKFLAGYLQATTSPLNFGICHGTRRGNEQKWFRETLRCEVIGTEISDSAAQFLHTLRWDFHDPNPDWIGKADFIYSNSFDHSYDPESCLNTWIDSLRIGGLCILEHSNLHGPEGANELDPFGAEIELMPYLIARWGKGRFYLKEIIDAPEKPASLRALNFLVIQRAK